MSEEKGYQGWKNYETWAVHLWISNEQGTHERYDELAAECYAEAVRNDLDDTREQWTQSASSGLGESIKRDLDDDAELPRALDGTVYADLLNAALSEVDWFEIAEAYVENIDRDQIEQDERLEASETED